MLVSLGVFGVSVQIFCRKKYKTGETFKNKEAYLYFYYVPDLLHAENDWRAGVQYSLYDDLNLDPIVEHSLSTGWAKTYLRI